MLKFEFKCLLDLAIKPCHISLHACKQCQLAEDKTSAKGKVAIVLVSRGC